MCTKPPKEEVKAMSKFNVGDKVIRISDYYKKMHVGDVDIVEGTDDYGNVKLKRFGSGHSGNSLTLVKEAKMSKYQELKSRIEALDNGWTKEADDIITEIMGKDPIDIFIRRDLGGHTGYGRITIDKRYPHLKTEKRYLEVEYRSQCQKNKAFKEALIWLLDHSNINKEDHSDEIKSLKADVEKIQARIKELEQ